MNEPANDNDKKPRKQRAKGPKAPNKKARPTAWAAYQIDRAYRIVRKVLISTDGWTIDAVPGLSGALSMLLDSEGAFRSLPDDFKAPRKRRAKKDLQVGTDSSNI